MTNDELAKLRADVENFSYKFGFCLGVLSRIKIDTKDDDTRKTAQDAMDYILALETKND